MRPSSSASNVSNRIPAPSQTSSRGISLPIRKSSRRISPGWMFSSRSSSLVIILDSDIVGGSVVPVEADAPLLVDTDAISRWVGIFQLLEAISARDCHVPQPVHRIELTQLAPGRALDVRSELTAAGTRPNALRFRVGKAADHGCASCDGSSP